MSLRLTPVGVMDALPKKTKIVEGKVSYLEDGTKVYTKGVYENKLKTMFLPNPDKDPKLSNKRVPLEFTLHTYVNHGKVYPYNSKKKNDGVLRNEQISM